MFVWNANLIRELVGVVPPTDWVIPLIHGFFRQVLFELDGGRSVSLTLLARRSRHFAGTRYLRRGVNWHGTSKRKGDTETQRQLARSQLNRPSLIMVFHRRPPTGFVANEVETEQIVTDADGESYGKGVLTSLVQVRGSIPLFWQHTNLMSPKPGIVLDPCDPSYIATRAHFHRLKCRYGDGIVVLSLINQVDGHRETKLGEAFTHVVSVLNASPGEASADSTATATGVESGDEQGGGETKRNDIKDKGGTGDTDDANGTDGADGTDGAARTEKGIRTDSIYMSNGSELCPSEPLMYITFDFAACSKSTTQNVIEAVSAVSDSMQSKIGFFRTSRPVGKGNGSSWSEGVQAVRQAGILRSNCIDCKMHYRFVVSLLCCLLFAPVHTHNTHNHANPRTTTHNMSHSHAHSQSNSPVNAHALTQLILTTGTNVYTNSPFVCFLISCISRTGALTCQASIGQMWRSFAWAGAVCHLSLPHSASGFGRSSLTLYGPSSWTRLPRTVTRWLGSMEVRVRCIV